MKYVEPKIIKETLAEAAKVVCPTMGPKGRLAILADDFSRPYLTDDGVTVAKELLNFDDPFKKMVSISVVEASSNTEKSAFDGTTLTVLLLNEFYKDGLKLIEGGMHPQTAADTIKGFVDRAVVDLKMQKIQITPANSEKLIRDVSNITTKIPEIGELVYQAYTKAGSDMNVIIEHDRKIQKSEVEHIDGMVVNSGFFSPELQNLAGEDGVWRRDKAKLFLLSEGILTVNGLKGLFASIPDRKTPLVFVFDRNYNPEMLKGLIENLSANKFDFTFIFINDSRPDEIFLDLAARTGGKIQSATFNTTDYLYEYAGTADHIEVEIDKSTIIAKGDKDEVKKRLDAYRKELKDNEFTTGYVRADTINRRMGNLGAGVTKIKIAAQSITEYRTIRFKLDDAIGAVRCALRDGVVLGSGKALYLLSQKYPIIESSLQAPMKTILSNAGYDMPNKEVLLNERRGLDAKTGLEVDLYDAGIIDSYTSIETAIKNASSIACSYLRAYILINQNVKEKD